MEPDPIKCPGCQSTNWRCWDERDHWFEDESTGELHQLPVGYLICNDCHRAWTHHNWTDLKHIGEELEE